MSHNNPTARVHRVFLVLLALLALGFWTTSVFAQSTADIYYIHPDHLNTPRVITNNVNQVVWRWDNLDPFGANLPNENPGGLGIFTCNLRLPGQYFDRETKLHYNYFRDYDPAVGRYLQSDLLGLAAGPNTYAYARVSPLKYSDAAGLASPEVDCKKLGFPFQPDPCIDSGQCFDNADRQLKRCNSMIWPTSKFACIRCNETYTGSCPGKVPDARCRNQACIPTSGGKG
jgi:RHS repeat-associated protein